MPQSNVIFFYLFAAFVIYVTIRGELPLYLGFLLSTPQDNSIVRSDLPPVQTSSVSDTAKTLASAAQLAAVFA